ncbi:S-layer homology domain-containing protein [Paenibacillus sp. MY03]|uniref:S-layer homology domain-containing protein n=1 Tax=Paenibacillus sp. MY03 TaxID=302980 RepID=UPI0015C65B22|nr:S-layer homology domain-containing protein [Paenibacillus sp. MY03]
MKKSMKQGTVALAAGMLIAASILPAAASAAPEHTLEMYFPVDIENHWAYRELDNFVVADLLKGYRTDEGEVEIRPEQSITRAEFVTLLVRSLGLKSDKAQAAFQDVPSEEWYADSVQIASSLGIVNGITTTEFKPDQLIERGEIAAMVVRAFPDVTETEDGAESEAAPFEDVPADDYFAADAIASASGAGIVNGITELEFKPFQHAKRAEAVVMLQRALNQQDGDLPSFEQLESVILTADEAELAAINQGELEGLSSLLGKQYTAFQLTSLEQYIEGMKELVGDGIAISVEETGERSIELVSASDRYAIVKSTGGSWLFKYAYDGQQQAETVSSDGHYYMKKTEDGSWKVYAIFEQ